MLQSLSLNLVTLLEQDRTATAQNTPGSKPPTPVTVSSVSVINVDKEGCFTVLLRASTVPSAQTCEELTALEEGLQVAIPAFYKGRTFRLVGTKIEIQRNSRASTAGVQLSSPRRTKPATQEAAASTPGPSSESGADIWVIIIIVVLVLIVLMGVGTIMRRRTNRTMKRVLTSQQVQQSVPAVQTNVTSASAPPNESATSAGLQTVDGYRTSVENPVYDSGKQANYAPYLSEDGMLINPQGAEQMPVFGVAESQLGSWGFQTMFAGLEAEPDVTPLSALGAHGAPMPAVTATSASAGSLPQYDSLYSGGNASPDFHLGDPNDIKTLKDLN